MMPQWISRGSLWLIYTRASQLHWICYNRNMAHTLTRAARCYLEVDAHCRVETSAEEIEACLGFPQGNPIDLQGAYSLLKWWYQYVK